MTRNIRVAVVHPKTVYGCLICEFRLIDSSSQSRLGTFDRLFLLSRISCNWLNLEKYLVGICEMAFLSKDNSRNVVFYWLDRRAGGQFIPRQNELLEMFQSAKCFRMNHR